MTDRALFSFSSRAPTRFSFTRARTHIRPSRGKFVQTTELKTRLFTANWSTRVAGNDSSGLRSLRPLPQLLEPDGLASQINPPERPAVRLVAGDLDRCSRRVLMDAAVSQVEEAVVIDGRLVTPVAEAGPDRRSRLKQPGVEERLQTTSALLRRRGSAVRVTSGRCVFGAGRRVFGSAKQFACE